VLGGDDRGQLVGAFDQQVAEAEEDVRPLDEARRAPGRQRRRGRRDRGIVSAVEAKATSACTAPVAG
jgi:hypothetical protein